jgi:hypothetical protein
LIYIFFGIVTEIAVFGKEKVVLTMMNRHKLDDLNYFSHKEITGEWKIIIYVNKNKS